MHLWNMKSLYIVGYEWWARLIFSARPYPGRRGGYNSYPDIRPGELLIFVSVERYHDENCTYSIWNMQFKLLKWYDTGKSKMFWTCWSKVIVKGTRYPFFVIGKASFQRQHVWNMKVLSLLDQDMSKVNGLRHVWLHVFLRPIPLDTLTVPLSDNYR